MLYNLLYPLHEKVSAFNLFQYITFRAAYALLTALVISWLVGGRLIRWLGERQETGQPIREDGPATHLAKRGTPTMGGLLILVALAGSVLLWADLANVHVWLALLATLGFGAIGFADDWLKLTRGTSRGMPARWKFACQLVLGLLLAAVLARLVGTAVDVPVVRASWELGAWYVPFAVFVLVGTSNAVNLTDGLDGLAVGPAFMTAGALAVIAYAAGHAVFADYLKIPHVPGAGELAVVCAAAVGACLGFLWYNAYPAQVFMGDVGALALGGLLGYVALAVRQPFVLAIAGGLFVLEALSVIVQVASFRLTGRRVFRMAPLHHHFELKGWPEPKVVARLWIVSIVLAIAALSTLKVR